MKPPQQPPTWPRPTRKAPGAEVHVPEPPWGRWLGAIGRRASLRTGAGGWFSPAAVADRGRRRAPRTGPRHLALARGLNRADTLHHGTELPEFRVREGGFVQRRII